MMNQNSGLLPNVFAIIQSVFFPDQKLIPGHGMVRGKSHPPDSRKHSQPPQSLRIMYPLHINIQLYSASPQAICFLLQRREEWIRETLCLPSRSFKINSDNTNRNTVTVRQTSHENKHSRLSIHTSYGASESWKLHVYPQWILGEIITFLEGF